MKNSHISTGLASFLASIIVASTLYLTACNTTPTTPPETNISDSTDVGVTHLEFGETLSSLPLQITVPNASDRWTLQRRRASSWLSIDAEQGSGSRQLTVSIDRSKLPPGISRDRLVIRGLRSLTTASKNGAQLTADTAKTIAISVTNPGTAQAMVQSAAQILQQQLSSVLSGMTLPTRVDTTISMVGSFALTSASGTTSYSSMGAFVVGTNFLADVGSAIQLTGKTGGTAISMAKRGLSYTSSRSGTTVSGSIYAPSSVVIVPRNITFDGTTPHTFTVPASSGFAGFTDNVISAAPIALNSAPTSVAQSRSLTLTWQPTAQADDSVFVVLTLAADSIPRAVPTIADDNAGTVTIAQQTLATLLGGKTGTGTLSVVRFRYKIVRSSAPARGLLSEAQRSYTVTITQ